VLSSHKDGVKSLAFSKEHHLLMSASWDSTINIHHTSGDLENRPLPTTLNLPHKPFSISITPSKLVVAMASRAVNIYDLKSLALLSSQSQSELSLDPWQRRESSLKFQTRAIACMPNDEGYASSSIEGRVAVEWFDPSPEAQAKKYAFKCHRQPASDSSGTDIVYPVNALAFHPVHGTFASGGGDGFVLVWDGITKRRIRQYPRFPASIASLDFSADGKYLAIAVSPGFEDGKEGESQGPTKVFVRELSDSEAKPKAK
jgi:cell cycle arrest protein BUB3